MLTGSPAHLTPGNSPNAARFAGELIVRDEWGSWIIGVLARQQDVVVELGFEHWQYTQICWPNTPITYLRLDRGPHSLFEFQLGYRITPPHPDIVGDLARLLNAWVGYRPYMLPERTRPDAWRDTEEHVDAYPSRVSTRRPKRGRKRPSPGARGLRYPMGRP